jgi:hypothetical protein
MHALGEGSAIAYFVFDLLHLDGEDLTGRPIEERSGGSGTSSARGRPPRSATSSTWSAAAPLSSRRPAGIAWKESSPRPPGRPIAPAPGDEEADVVGAGDEISPLATAVSRARPRDGHGYSWVS